MKVLKFGGSSLARPERILAAVEIVHQAANATPVVMVVSALGGVTNALARAASLSARGSSDYKGICDEIETRHRDGVEELIDTGEQAHLLSRYSTELSGLRALLHGISLVRECTPRTMDHVLSYGERLSAPLVAGALRARGVAAQDCDTRDLIITDSTFGSAHVETVSTYDQIRRHFARHEELQVLTGFIGATPQGDTTTLGRGGSDLTAALVGAALDAQVIEIWTDVDGVMSADPRLVPDAFSLDCVSYEEIMELSHFGAKVVYPPTVHPVRNRSIPLLIKNTLNPSFPGTQVVEKARPGKYPVRGISSINRVALLRLEGDGMVGVPGIARRLFRALAQKSISVVLISQASSEHSICFAVPPEAVSDAKSGIEGEFDLERRTGLIDDLVIEQDLSVIAVVGEGMRERPGIAGLLFRVLGDEEINVRAIAQGSSELNISLVLSRQDEARALKAIHDAFFAPAESVHHLFVVGTGRVGSELLKQLAETRPQGRPVALRLSGVSNRRRMLLDRHGIAGDWQDQLSSRGEPTDLETLTRYVEATPGPSILVDLTASDEVPKFYQRFLAARGAVVAANKRPLCGPFAESPAAWGTRSRGFYYETTVGAGLPVIDSLRKLLQTGDRVVKIEGIFSGTVSFLFGQLRSGISFSEAVRRAHRNGYTEPDPRQDLSGADVARKLLILAREVGLETEPEDVEVESLLPDAKLDSLTLEAFWAALPRVDEIYHEHQKRCAQEGRVLCYLARLQDAQARVVLEAVPPEHPCANVCGPDNLFAFYTERYAASPLVVRGPGAGPAVTAAGVYADVLKALGER